MDRIEYTAVTDRLAKEHAEDFRNIKPDETIEAYAQKVARFVLWNAGRELIALSEISDTRPKD